jgi:hypothetical protein
MDGAMQQAAQPERQEIADSFGGAVIAPRILRGRRVAQARAVDAGTAGCPLTA